MFCLLSGHVGHLARRIHALQRPLAHAFYQAALYANGSTYPSFDAVDQHHDSIGAAPKDAVLRGNYVVQLVRRIHAPSQLANERACCIN